MERLIRDTARPRRGRGNPVALALDCFAALAMTALIACTPNAATLTLVNHSAKDIKVNIDERPQHVRAGGFVNFTSIRAGDHFIKVANAPVQTLTLAPRLTTVIDLSGDGCYVVANFSPQYEQNSGGTIIIEERFKKQPIFTACDAMLVPYGDTLPRKVDIGVKVRRLHSVDCSIIEVDRAILEAVSRLP